MKDRDKWRYSWIPKLRVPLKYWRSLHISLPLSKWFVDGVCMNFDNLLTAKVMSDRLTRRYYRLPKVCWYKVALVGSEPSWSNKVEEDAKAAWTGLNVSIFILARTSRKYLQWTGTRLLLYGVTSMLRKYKRKPISLIKNWVLCWSTKVCRATLLLPMRIRLPT